MKLDEQKYRDIKRLLFKGVSSVGISRELGMNEATVSEYSTLILLGGRESRMTNLERIKEIEEKLFEEIELSRTMKGDELFYQNKKLDNMSHIYSTYIVK